jgi:hypothetical protein
VKSFNYPAAGTGALCLGALAIMLHASANAQDATDLESCANLEDPQARLACYDAASQGLQEAKPASPPAGAAPARESLVSPAAENSTPPSAGISEEQPDTEDQKEEPLRLLLTDCQKGPTSKWYFYFDNGQVWKQRDNDRFSIKDCNGEVAISKDFFGYKIEFQTTENKIRAARVK